MFVRRDGVHSAAARVERRRASEVPSDIGFPSSHSERGGEGRCLRHQQPPRLSLETRSTDAFSLTWLPPAERELQGRARETSGPVCESIRLTMARQKTQPGKDNWCHRFFKCKSVEAKWTEGHAVCEKESRAGCVKISAQTKC